MLVFKQVSVFQLLAPRGSQIQSVTQEAMNRDDFRCYLPGAEMHTHTPPPALRAEALGDILTQFRHPFTAFSPQYFLGVSW